MKPVLTTIQHLHEGSKVAEKEKVGCRIQVDHFFRGFSAQLDRWRWHVIRMYPNMLSFRLPPNKYTTCKLTLCLFQLERHGR